MIESHTDTVIKLPRYVNEALCKAAEEAGVQDEVFIAELLERIYHEEGQEGRIALTTLDLLERLQESQERAFGEG